MTFLTSWLAGLGGLRSFSGRALDPIVKVGRFRLLMALVGTVLPSATVAPIPVEVEPTVRLVCNGTFPGGCPQGSHSSTIQAAVNAAKPDDWILVWPGVCHEKGNATTGVMITKPGLHLRGLDRNLVVVDGSLTEIPRRADPAGCAARVHRLVNGPH